MPCVIVDYDEKNEPLVKIEFLLIGDNIDVELINELLQIPNAEILKKGELLKERKNPVITNSWKISTEFVRNPYVREEVEKIILILKDKVNIINKIYELFDDINIVLEIVIEVTHKDYQPAIIFSRNTLKFISDIHASIDVDMYFMFE